MSLTRSWVHIVYGRERMIPRLTQLELADKANDDIMSIIDIVPLRPHPHPRRLSLLFFFTPFSRFFFIIIIFLTWISTTLVGKLERISKIKLKGRLNEDFLEEQVESLSPPAAFEPHYDTSHQTISSSDNASEISIDSR